MAGGSNWHIIFTHLVPNLLPLSFLYMMFTVTGLSFLEAVLSFFGLMDVNMSWGLMINIAQSQGYLLSGTRYWWLLIPAGAAISFCARLSTWWGVPWTRWSTPDCGSDKQGACCTRLIRYGSHISDATLTAGRL